MIKITSELRQNSGFKSSISVLEITSYTTTETTQLVTGSTPAIPAIGGKNIIVNVSVYKSLTDKANGANPFQPMDFPYNFSIQPAPEDEINESYLYNKVSAKLNDLGFNTEFA